LSNALVVITLILGLAVVALALARPWLSVRWLP
jgi:hypothetical protein